MGSYFAVIYWKAQEALTKPMMDPEEHISLGQGSRTTSDSLATIGQL